VRVKGTELIAEKKTHVMDKRAQEGGSLRGEIPSFTQGLKDLENLLQFHLWWGLGFLKTTWKKQPEGKKNGGGRVRTQENA